MKQHHRGRRLAAGLLAAAAGLLDTPVLPAHDRPAHGLVVERAGTASTAQPDGLKPGDVLTAWERAASAPANPSSAQGDLRSPFDLTEIEIGQAPRGVVTLRGSRGGQPLAVTMPSGPWQLATRPAMQTHVLEHHTRGRAAFTLSGDWR